MAARVDPLQAPADDAEHLQRLAGEVARRLEVLVREGIGPRAATPLVDLTAFPEESALRRAIDGFGLDSVAAGLLVVAACAELDGRLGAVLAGLDPVLRRSLPRVDVAMAVAGGSPWSPADRARLSGPLVAGGLLDVLDAERPWPERTLRAPDRVVAHLLGSDAPDELVQLARLPGVHADTPAALDVARALQAGDWTVWLRDTTGTGRAAAVTAFAALHAPALSIDTRRHGRATTAELLTRAVREVAFAGGGLVIGPIDPAIDADALHLIGRLPPVPLVLLANAPWDPTTSPVVPVQLDATPLSLAERETLWAGVLESIGIDDPVAMDDLATLRLPPEQLPAIAVTARSRAAADGVPVAVRHVRRAALAVGASRLDAQAQRVAPRATFDDLVLPADMLAELRRLPGRYRTRDIVGGQWQIGHRTGGGRGITCLFAGPSGTGKTLAAEAVAHALGVELFVIDLSQIVDKYIGETEKNLDRVFSEAEGVNGVLLFDEADALFGKRTDVRSSHDRHANVEVAYLLQRMERYDGVAVLTTNLRGNIDEAFSRRLDIICAFAEPDEPARLLLWERHLPPALPRAADVDLAVLARHFAISGGIIRNAAVTAAHAAADAGGAVTQRMLLEAVRREYAKLGRLFPETAVGLLDAVVRGG
jgi:hypothetical protein